MKPEEIPQLKNESAEKEENERQEKELKLQEIRNNVESWADIQGRGIDEGIKETVAIFSASEMPTSDSCEGHIDENGLKPPYVEIEALSQPERWKGVDTAIEEIQPLKESDNEKFHEEHTRIMQEFGKKPETEKYQKWEEKNKQLTKKSKELLEEFYKDREVDPAEKLKINEGYQGNPRIYSGSGGYTGVIEEKKEELSEKERQELSGKLENSQQEMNEFTEFLKNKYFEK